MTVGQSIDAVRNSLAANDPGVRSLRDQTEQMRAQIGTAEQSIAVTARMERVQDLLNQERSKGTDLGREFATAQDLITASAERLTPEMAAQRKAILDAASAYGQVASAVNDYRGRHDFILSGEIMAISLGTVADKPLWEQAIVLVVVAIVITAGVYGVVGFIVKMDDIGLHLAERSSSGVRIFGRGLVKAMPVLMAVLGVVGTAAMLWVGGGLIVHGLHEFHWDLIPGTIHHVAEGAARSVPAIGGAVDWIVNAAGGALVGLVIGGLIVAALHMLRSKAHKG